MTTPTTTVADTDGDTPQELTRKQRREADVQARARQIVEQELPGAMRRQSKEAKAAKKRGEQFNPLTEKAMYTALLPEAEKRAKGEVRREYRNQRAADTAKAAGRSVKSAVATTAYRNRKQAAPWALAAPFAACAAVGAGWGVTLPAVPALVMPAVAAGASWWVWARGIGQRVAPLSQRVPAPLHRRVRVGAAVALLTVAAASLITWDSPNVWAAFAALVANTAVVALPWWKSVEHPIPASSEADDAPEPEPQPEPDELDAQQKRIMGILNAWEQRVAHPRGPVPGSTMTAHEQTAAVESYRIELDTDRDMVADDVDGHIKKIAMKLGVMASALSFEPDLENPAVVWMRHLVRQPSVDYTGPIVYANGVRVHSRWEIPHGATIDIVVANWVDGTGETVFRIAADGGVTCAFILASRGGGKTVLFDVIAVALRMLGVYIIYVDGQDGASSQALQDNCDEFYTSKQADIDTLWSHLEAFRTVRNRQLRTDKSLRNRYSYDPQRPPMITVIEECHAITGAEFPGNKFNTYGEALGDFARESRKLGGGLLLASQDFDLDTFGRSVPLRDACIADGNLFTLRFTDRTRGGMLPAGTPSLTTLPKGGFGYQPAGDRPSAMYRVPGLVYDPSTGPDYDAGQMWPEEWMASYEPSTLEPELSKAMGIASAPARTSPTEGASTGPALVSVPTVASLPSFGDITPDEDEDAADVDDGPTEADIQAAAVLDREPVSDKERELLEALGFDGKEWTASYVASQLGISHPAATNRLKRAATRGLTSKTESGKWINRKKENQI